MAIIKNFLDSYVEYSSLTIAHPDLYKRWGGVIAISSMLGRRFWIPRGHLKVYPNFYVMLMGEPGTGKGIACDICQGILTEAGYEYFGADRSSKEKFLQDLADGISFNKPNTMDDLLSSHSIGGDGEQTSFLSTESRECLVIAEEFSDFIGQNNSDFIAFLTKVWSYNGTYRYRLKTGRSVGITDPYLNILGGSSSAAFALSFPPEIIAQGFLARLVLVAGEFTGSRETWPKRPDSALNLASDLSAFLANIKENCKGEIALTAKALKDLEKLDQEFGGVDDPRFKDYNVRRFTQLLKLCIVHAAARGECILRIEDIEQAHQLLCDTEYLMPKALGSFGKSKNADVSNKILQCLYTATQPVPTTFLWRIVCDDLEKLQDLTDILHKLQYSGRIQSVSGKGWLPKLAAKKGD